MDGAEFFLDPARRAAMELDDAAVRVARSRNALEVALGETLARLFRGDRLLRLACSRESDYARERLGVPPRTVFAWVRLARGLAERPCLRRAVLADAVTPRKALTILPVAFGRDEARWTAAAMSCTVADLERAVRSQGKEAPDSFEGETLWLRMTPDQQDRLDSAIDVVQEREGFGTARWRCVEAICQEWLADHGEWVPEGEGPGERPPPAPAPPEALLRQLDAAEEAVRVLGEAAGEEAALPGDAVALDARAKRLLAAHRGFDTVFGPLALRVVDGNVAGLLQYRSLDEYAKERLGMSGRALRERAWLERRMCALPELREALASGRITFSKALLLARDATWANVAARIEEAASTTLQQLQREATGREARRNRAAGVRRLWGPKDAALAVADAIASAREWSRRERGLEIDAGEALAVIADHFVEVWTAVEEWQRPWKHALVLRRHGGLCAVPGCSRPALHRHHILYRARGGGDDPENRVGLCAPHHLHGIHKGWLRVTGRAGERLVWELGTTGPVPLETWVTLGDDDVRRADSARARAEPAPPAARPDGQPPRRRSSARRPSRRKSPSPTSSP